MPHSRRSSAARFHAALLFSVAALLGATVRAQPSEPAAPEPALRLTWESDDPACSGSDVNARALHLVTPGVVPRPLRARVEVRREAEQWLVRLQTESGELSGRRILRAESCAEIERAIALLLAMAMESKGDVLPPELPATPVEPPPQTPPAVSPAPGHPSLEAPLPIADTKPPASERDGAGIDLGWFARLDGKVASGLQPGLGVGMGLVVGVRLGDLDVGASGAFWPQTDAQVLDRPGRVGVTRQDVGLRMCWNAWRTGGLVLAPCLNPELTFFRYVSESVVETRRGTKHPMPALSGAADIRYELLDRRLSLLISPGVTWQRPQPFEIQLGMEPDEEWRKIYTTAGFAARLELGVDARF
jgi:hypothetical protein